MEKHKRTIVLFTLLIILLVTGCAKAQQVKTEGDLRFVNVHTTYESIGNGWMAGETYIGLLNDSKVQADGLWEYLIQQDPVLVTKEGKEYPVDVEIGGLYSIASDYKIPLDDFTRFPPGFKLYAFGQNDTYIKLEYQFAEAATPIEILFADGHEGIDSGSFHVYTNIDLTDSTYEGGEMYYGKQPIKTIKQLKGDSIPMQDDALKAEFTGKCMTDNSGRFYAQVEVENTDKLDGYLPESEWAISRYMDGNGNTHTLKFSPLGQLISSIGPGQTMTLYFELEGIVVLYQGWDGDEYFILDYSDCN
ncbi:hypothetical protein JR338_05795 [Chloroflexota bacterium]|nr:hypothetical protein JR338_05795 [Chloroflexota bacterium]